MNKNSLFIEQMTRLPRSEFGVEGRMIQLRLWQHIVNEMLKEKAFKVPVHLGFGSEALVSAIDETLGNNDQLILTHRNAVYNMSRAESLGVILDEYKEQIGGLGNGKLGSMNLTNMKGGITYSSSILGNNFSVACGLGFANKIKNTEGIVYVVTGDGAMEEGAFYEALVFASSQNLKVLFVVDNNNHSMVSSIAERRCNIDLKAMCMAVNIPFEQMEGNNVFEYVKQFEAIHTAIKHQDRPACVEIKTSLLNQHAGPTPGWPTDPLKIEFSPDLIIEESSRDPLAVLRSTIGTDLYGIYINRITR